MHEMDTVQIVPDALVYLIRHRELQNMSSWAIRRSGIQGRFGVTSPGDLSGTQHRLLTWSALGRSVSSRSAKTMLTEAIGLIGAPQHPNHPAGSTPNPAHRATKCS